MCYSEPISNTVLRLMGGIAIGKPIGGMLPIEQTGPKTYSCRCLKCGEEPWSRQGAVLKRRERCGSTGCPVCNNKMSGRSNHEKMLAARLKDAPYNVPQIHWDCPEPCKVNYYGPNK